MNIFTALALEWAALAATETARHALRGWAQSCPDLGGFAGPADLVAAITSTGHPERSCALLSDVLVVAGHDRLATRAVLQAVIPGLRHTANRRWQNTTRNGGPWRDAGEVASDAVSAAWEAIDARRGQRHQRPAAVIVRPVERRLRHNHERWRRETRQTVALDVMVPDPSESGTDAAYSGEQQAAAIITEALACEVIDPTEATIIYVTGVLGHTLAEVERSLALHKGAGYRTAWRGRSALRAWYESRPSQPDQHHSAASGQRTPPASTNSTVVAPLRPSVHRIESSEGAPMLPLLLTPTDAAFMLGVSRSKIYSLMRTGEIPSVCIGTCRRIRQRELVDYIERLQRQGQPRQTMAATGASGRAQRRPSSSDTRTRTQRDEPDRERTGRSTGQLRSTATDQSEQVRLAVQVNGTGPTQQPLATGTDR